MRGLLDCLSRIGWVRRLGQAIQLHTVANSYLKIFPVRRRLHSGVVYRSARIESIPLAVEMFEKGVTYNREALGHGIRNFVDLGCNVGYFTILLADLANNEPLKGIMVDANPDVIEEAKWHVQANPSLAKVYPNLGLAGASPQEKDADFYVYASNICSARDPNAGPSKMLPGKWEKVKVPCVNITQMWADRFGKLRCHLLKVDIEGAELDFFHNEAAFLVNVDRILLEWHKWAVQLPQIEEFLKPHGFKLAQVFEEDENLGTCLFTRPPQPPLSSE